MRKVIHSNDAPEAIGPYAQAIEAGDFIFVSGQIGIDPESGEVVEGIENQTKQVLENLQAVLKEASVDFTNVVKFTIYLASMDDFATVNDIYGDYLTQPYPARVAIEVSRLPKDVRVEMDAIAYKEE